MANRRFFGNHDLKEIGSAVANDYFSIKDVGPLTSFYVNGGTGSDANPGTLLLPFATIQRALDEVGASVRPGSVTINVADGTYNENLFFKNYVGGTDDNGSPFVASLFPSLIRITGNVVTPANVKIIGDDTTWATVQVVGCLAEVYLDGVQIETTTPADFTYGIYVERATAILGNVNIINAGTCGLASYDGIIFLDDSAAGGTFTCVYYGFIATWNSLVQSFRSVGLTITGFSESGISVGSHSVFNSYYAITLTADVGGATDGFLCNENSSIELGGIFAETVNITDCVNGFRAVANSVIGGPFGSTMNITDCGRPLSMRSGGKYTEALGSGNTWNYLGTSGTIIAMPPGTETLSDNNLSGCTYSYSEGDTDYRYGFDHRYVTYAIGSHPGTLPSASSVYFGASGVQVNHIPLFINGNFLEPDTREVIELSVVSRTGNGIAATDVYTVYINGIATALTATMTNDNEANGVATGIVLSGLHDTLAVRVTTDAVGTAASDVMVRVLMRNK